MPQTVPAALQTHLNTRATTMASFVKLKRKDGTIFCFTDHDQALQLNVDSDGQQTYQPGAAFNRTSLPNSETMDVPTVDLECVMTSDGFSEADLIAGRFDDAEVKVFFANWASLSDGIIKARKGTLGGIDRQDFFFKAEFRGLMQDLQTQIGSLVSTRCRSDFGATGVGTSSGCRFDISPVTWQANRGFLAGTYVVPTVPNGFQYIVVSRNGDTGGVEPVWPTVVDATIVDGGTTWRARPAVRRTGSVTEITSRLRFKVDNVAGVPPDNQGGTKTGGFFAVGTVEFTSGDNVGVKREIVSWTGPDVSPVQYEIICMLPFPFDIAAGDTVVLITNCDKTLPVCRDNYLNVPNMRAEPYVPGADSIFQIHKAPASQAGKK